jgi:hypothetical protein
MSNELIPLNELTDIAVPEGSLKDLTTADDFFYRIQLYGGKSNAVQEGTIEANHYGIPEDSTVIDLGAEVDCLICSWRSKALSTADDPVMESFDPASDVFKDIMARSSIKDSGCMYGPEFLLYVPSVDRFLTFFMSSKTARREARKMEPLLRCAATLKSRIIKQNKFIWTGPVVIACSTPLDLPPLNIIKAKIEKFQNPPARNEELAEDDGRDR